MKSADQVAKKWAANLGNATQSITQGVQAVQVAPGVAAAAQADVAAANYAAAIQSGKWASRVSAVPLSQWQQSMLKKGLPRIQEGASQATPKMAAFMNQLLPAVEAARASLPPRGSKAANRQRMIQFSDSMANFRKS